MNLSKDKKIEDLLIGDYKIIQSDNLYRFTSDSVLLARFPLGGEKKVLDLCSGSGIVGFHYFAQHGCNKVTFVEVQSSLANMCSETIKLNNLEEKLQVVNTNLKDFDGRGEYDLVLCNPPYKKEGSGFTPDDNHLAICRAEVKCNLLDIVKCASRSLKYGGKFCMCHKVERLPEVICDFVSCGIQPTRLRFVKGKGNDQIYLILIEGVKGKKPPFKVEGVYENNATDFKG